MRLSVCVLAIVVLASAAHGQVTWPQMSAGAGDTTYAAPADQARVFDLNNLPALEGYITSASSDTLGSVRKVEVLSDGDAKVKFTEYSDVGWVITVTDMGTATSVKVSAWSKY